MANDNKQFDKLVSGQDDDPTAELEILTAEACAENDSGRSVDTESDANTFDFDKARPDIGDTGETIANLKLDLKARTESIKKLQFDIEHLRSRWTGLEKEIKVREEVTTTLTADLKIARKKQSKTERLLRKRDKELDSLTLKLSLQEQSLEESARQIEQARIREQDSEARFVNVQAQLTAAEDRLASLTNESLAGRSEQEETGVKVKSLSSEVAELKKSLAESRATVTDLQQYVDGRKNDWEAQHRRLGENKEDRKSVV